MPLTAVRREGLLTKNTHPVTNNAAPTAASTQPHTASAFFPSPSMKPS